MIKDIKILSVIIIISAALFAYTFTFDEVPEILAQGMQPTMMPRLIFSLIIFLSIFQLIQNKKLKSDTKEILPILISTFIKLNDYRSNLIGKK